jgi:hypothetical protein
MHHKGGDGVRSSQGISAATAGLIETAAGAFVDPVPIGPSIETAAVRPLCPNNLSPNKPLHLPMLFMLECEHLNVNVSLWNEDSR